DALELGEPEEALQPEEVTEPEPSAAIDDIDDALELDEPEESLQPEEVTEPEPSAAIDDIDDALELDDFPELPEPEEVTEPEPSAEIDDIDDALELDDFPELSEPEEVTKPEPSAATDDIDDALELGEPEEALQPEEVTEPEPSAATDDIDDALELDDFPELSEPEEVTKPEPSAAIDDIDDALELDDFPELPEPEEVTEPEPSAATDTSLEIDDDDLPEYDEDDALADAIEQSQHDEPVSQSEPVIELRDEDLPEYNEEDALADTSNESLQLADLDIPKYGESAPLSGSDDMADLDLPVSEVHSEVHSEEGLPDEFEEHDTINDGFDNDDAVDFKLDELELPSLEEIPSESAQELAHNAYNEQTFDELLAEHPPEQGASFDFDSPVDSVMSDSAGMDIDAMLEVGGEDWNGFSLSSEQQAQITDDIPEDEQKVWDADNRPEQAQILDENWEDQPEMDDLGTDKGQFRSIDDLMAEVEQEEKREFEEEDLKLEVGLSDFPDVIGDTGDVDVDNNSEAAGKLDLAKIYLEMNDSQGAIKLLEEAIVDGSDEIRREAKNLIDEINGR
ncbi:FimV/HubP family polar landmark protein, partial [Vibrio ostreicida]|uniref:FimV/HubP family polar landmark protein n=1 Tax=Vibrio ostreicida TaxID=526588 RepID=UPI003B5CE430